MSVNGDIQNFIQDAFSALNVVFEPVNNKVFVANIPEELREEVDDLERIYLTFDKNTFQNSDDSTLEYITYGSPILNWVADKVKGLGTVGTAVLPNKFESQESIREKLSNSYNLSNGKVLVHEFSEISANYVLFNFVLRLNGLEKQERLVQILVSDKGVALDSETCALFSHEKLDETSLSQSQLLDVPENLSKIAMAALEERVTQEKSDFLMRSDRKRTTEASQLNSYFSKMKLELEGLLATVSSSDQQKDIQFQIESVAKQLKQRLNEVEERYVCATELELVSALIVEHSDFSATLKFVKDDSDAIVSHQFSSPAYDFTAPPYKCAIASTNTLDLTFVHDGRLVATSCVAPCEESGELHPKNELVQCVATEKYFKQEFILECPVLMRPVSKKNLIECASCLQRVSITCVHRRKCEKCENPEPVAKTDNRVQRYIKLFPQLKGWREWKISSNRDVEILFLGGLLISGKLVLKRGTNVIVDFVTKKKLFGRWEKENLSEASQ